MAREALLTLTVLGRPGTRTQIEATVETGFTGALGLPKELVESLSLPLVGRGVAVLADGRGVETNYPRGGSSGTAGSGRSRCSLRREIHRWACLCYEAALSPSWHHRAEA